MSRPGGGIFQVMLEEHAITLLKAGRPLPLDLAARLMEAGVDIGALEDEHTCTFANHDAN